MWKIKVLIIFVLLAGLTFGSLKFIEHQALSQTSQYLWKDLFSSTTDSNLMIGSSTIQGLNEEALSACGAWLNRGIGNSTINHLKHYLNLTPLNITPNNILIYAGENDIASGISPQETLIRYLNLLQQLQSQFSQAIIHIIAVKPSPKRSQHWQGFYHLNDNLAQYAESKSTIIYHSIHDKIPEKDFALFSEDGIHLNSKGYQKIFTGVLNKCKRK